jgi:regulation of enolase protein 1 (concanavalin A-like superfamily)
MGAAAAAQTMEDFPVLVQGFSGVGPHLLTRSSPQSVHGSTLAWYCDPSAWQPLAGVSEGSGGSWKVDEAGQLIIAPPSKKDFWRKTFYTPTLCKDDGSCLFATMPATQSYMVETSFTLDNKRQFDQAGLCLRLGTEHWLKTGIECVDGQARLSCVVTNVYSDWSTQPWPAPRLRIRVHVIGSSFVVEAAPLDVPGAAATDETKWDFIRIANLDLKNCQPEDPLAGAVEAAQWPDPSAAEPPAGHLWMGVFACCPEEQDGCTATFHSFTIRKGTSFDHNADGNFE